MTTTNHAIDRDTIAARLREADWELGPQGQWLAHLIHRGNAPGCHTALRAVLMPPAHVAGAHLHRAHEVQVMVLKGFAATLLGDNLAPLVHGAGDPICVPPGTTHAAVNLSSTQWLLAVETISDPYSADVRPLPHLNAQVEDTARQLRRERAVEVFNKETQTVESVAYELIAAVAIPARRSTTGR